MTDLDSIFKSRDITLPTKVRLVKAMVFPVHSLLLMRVKITQFCKYVNCFNLGECIFTCLLLFSALVSKLALRKKSHVMTTYGNLGHCLPEQVGSK